MATNDLQSLIQDTESDENRSADEPRVVVEIASAEQPLVEQEDELCEEGQPSFPCCTTNPIYIGLGAWTKVTHAFMQVVVVILFCLAILVADWRVVRVDRYHLAIEATDTNQDDLLTRMVNESMFFSRRVGIFQECLTDKFNRSQNVAPPRCQMLDFLPRPGQHSAAYYHILHCFRSGMIIGPILTAISLLGLFLQSKCFLMKRKPPLTCLSLMVHALLFNTLLSIVFLVLEIGIVDHIYYQKDPGYPSTWPSTLRHYSHIHSYQMSASLFIVAMIGQLFLLAVDIVVARRFIHLTGRGQVRPRHAWFLK